MNRICPNCNSSLSGDEMYFCLNCGHKLEEEMILQKPTFRVKRRKLDPEKGQRSIKLPLKNFHIHLSKKLLLAFVLVLLVGAGAFAALYFLPGYNPPQNNFPQEIEQSTEEVTVPVEYENSMDLAWGQPNILFSKEELVIYIPNEVDFYLAGSNLSSSYNLFWGEIAESGLVDQLSEQIKENFAIFGREVDGQRHLAVVFYLAEELEDPESLEPLETENYQVQNIGQAIVVTNYEPFFTEVENASQGVAKNVSHKPQYNNYKRQLPESGQIIFMNFSEDKAALHSLALSYLPSAEINSLLETLTEDELENFVIRRNE